MPGAGATAPRAFAMLMTTRELPIAPSSSWLLYAQMRRSALFAWCRFNSSSGTVFAMLMTTRAGGQGLNLTGADTVILHDVDFNPQAGPSAEDGCLLGGCRSVAAQRVGAAVSKCMWLSCSCAQHQAVPLWM